MEWITPVIDRTQEDVDYVKELNEKYLNGTITDAEKIIFQDDLKGALNFDDLTRIQGNMQALSDALTLDLTITMPYEDVFRQSLMDEVDANIQSIYDTYGVALDISACVVPDGKVEHTHYCYWNWVEEVLLDVYNMWQSNLTYYTGNEISTGDSIGLL